MKIFSLLFITFLTLFPAGISYGQSVPPPSGRTALIDLKNSDSLLTNFGTDLNTYIIPALIALALVFFIYALLKFILVAGEKKEDARQQMIYGIIILAVIVGVWGLTYALLGVFGVSTGGLPASSIPTGA